MAPIQRNVLRIDDNISNSAPTFEKDRPNSNIHLVRDEKPMFSSLEQTGSRQNALMASAAIHIAGLTLLVVIPLFLMDSLRVPRYDAIMISPPLHQDQILEVTHWKAVALPEPKPKPMIAPPPLKPAVVKLELPREEEPKVVDVKPPETHFQPKPELVAAAFPQPEAPAAPKPAAVAPPKPEVKTDVFGGSSATATVNLPAKKVQTGGFGDPNGIRGDGSPNKPANIASLGSFDLPVGPGAGNGTGGAYGVKGVVASSGFGSGVASSGSGGGNGHGKTSGSVAQGGFGDVQPATGPAERKRDLDNQPTPVEITFKPRPDYTEEARKQKLEGEVLIHVLFAASGRIEVLDVIRGLGHGLDENAVRAAQQIRFKPALKDGKAVDSAATVHILFQLAY